MNYSIKERNHTAATGKMDLMTELNSEIDATVVDCK